MIPRKGTHPDLAFDTRAQVLIQPYRDGGSLLEEAEDKMNGSKKGFAPAASTTMHFACGIFGWTSGEKGRREGAVLGGRKSGRSKRSKYCSSRGGKVRGWFGCDRQMRRKVRVGE